MAEYVAKDKQTTQGGFGPILYRLYEFITQDVASVLSGAYSVEAVSDSSRFTGESGPQAGDYFVVKCAQTLPNGQQWMVLFAVGGAAVGGYANPGSGLWLKVNIGGSWDGTNKKFNGGLESEWELIDGAIPNNSAAMHLVAYTNVLIMIEDLDGAGTWQRGFYVGEIDSGDDATTDGMPFCYFSGDFSASSSPSTSIFNTLYKGVKFPNIARDGWNAGYAEGADFVKGWGRTVIGELTVEGPIVLRDTVVSPNSYRGTLKGVMQYDRDAGTGIPNADGTRKGYNGISFPA